MEGVEIHSASPISSDSSKDDLTKKKKPVRPPLGKHTTSWTSYMLREESEPSSSISPSDTGSGSNSGSGSGSGLDSSSSAMGETTSHVQDEAISKKWTTDTTMEDAPIDPELIGQAITTDILELLKPSTASASPSTPSKNPNIFTISDPITTTKASQPTQTSSPQHKSARRVHTRNTSISATMELPWNIDNTSSPHTQTSHKRNSSFGIAPPPKAGEITRNSSNSSYSDSDSSTADSPKLHPLMTRVATMGTPAPYTTKQAPSPYTTTSSSTFPSSNPYSGFDFASHQPKPHPTHSLTSPPGYTQNAQAHASFSTTHSNSYSQGSTNSISHTNTTTRSYPSISTTITTPSRRSSTYSEYSPLDTSAPPLYTSNTSPLYQNTTTTNNNSYGYNNTFFSPSFSFSAPKTPTPKKPARAGILDNDPNMYLSPDGTGAVEDESIWDAATKWMKSTSKKLSSAGENQGNGNGGGIGMAVGSGEYTISSGLWKMVAGNGGGGEKRDGY